MPTFRIITSQLSIKNIRFRKFAMSELQETAETLKCTGNDYFVKKDFSSAEKYYTKAIALCDDNAVLFANRSAANLELGHYQLALEDSENSIKINPKFIKAYFRKNASLKKLGRSHKECYDVWHTAYQNCEHTAELNKYYSEALLAWKKVFRKEPIIDSDDFMGRYKLLNDKRQKLSTMAHL